MSRKAFANINVDGSFRAPPVGVLSVSRGIPAVPEQGIPAIPEAYVLTLDRPFEPDRTHVVPVCRATATAPAERFNVGLEERRVVLVFLGESGAPCSMPFTVSIEEF